MAQGTSLFMSMSLLTALTEYCTLVNRSAKNPGIVIPSELDFVPGLGDDLESMIWVLTYAMMLRHQADLEGSDKAEYKRYVVDTFYGCLSYSALSRERTFLMSRGTIPRAPEPERWFPDPAQSKWFRRAMTLVEGQIKSIKPITFDIFDELCGDFITNE